MATSYRVTPGKPYHAFTSLRSATSARFHRIGLQWFDVNGKWLSVTWSWRIASATSAQKVNAVSGIAPTGAYTCTPIVEFQEAAAAEVHYTDKVHFGYGPYNYITNGNAETNTANWGSYIGSQQYDNTTAGVGTGSVKCTPAPTVNPTQSGASQSLSVSIPGDTQVTISSWVRIPVGRTSSRLILRDDTNNSSFYSTSVTGLVGGLWQRISRTTTIPRALNAERLYIIPCSHNGAEPNLWHTDIGWFDGVVLEVGPTMSPSFYETVYVPGGATPGYYVVEYNDETSDLTNSNWQAVRGAKQLVIPGATAHTLYDYESPPNKVRYYRARGVRTA